MSLTSFCKIQCSWLFHKQLSDTNKRSFLPWEIQPVASFSFLNVSLKTAFSVFSYCIIQQLFLLLSLWKWDLIFSRNALGLTGHKRFLHPFNLQKSHKPSETKSTLVFLLQKHDLEPYYIITHKVINSGKDFMGNHLQNHGS